jgi:hypothetical protein
VADRSMGKHAFDFTFLIKNLLNTADKANGIAK